MEKCKGCPRKKICRDECYGDNPCDFAKAFDAMTRKIDRRDSTIQKLKTQIELGVGQRGETNRSQLTGKAAGEIAARTFGEYVLTPVKDGTSGKVSWWISRKSFTTARYCFTASDEKEAEYQVKNGLSGYMRLLDETLDGAAPPDRIDWFFKDLLRALPKKPREDPGNDPGFWTDGCEVLCPSEGGAEVLARIMTDMLGENSAITVTTGWYDPFKTGTDECPADHAGFNYVRFEY